jgi:hypothetical protein
MQARNAVGNKCYGSVFTSPYMYTKQRPTMLVCHPSCTCAHKLACKGGKISDLFYPPCRMCQPACNIHGHSNMASRTSAI